MLHFKLITYFVKLISSAIDFYEFKYLVFNVAFRKSFLCENYSICNRVRNKFYSICTAKC